MVSCVLHLKEPGGEEIKEILVSKKFSSIYISNLKSDDQSQIPYCFY